MSETESGTLREAYFDAVRCEAEGGNPAAARTVKMARKLCKADRQDPDRMIFGLGGMVPENGPRGTFVAPTYIAPAWAAYYDLARGAIEYIDEMMERAA